MITFFMQYAAAFSCCFMKSFGAFVLVLQTMRDMAAILFYLFHDRVAGL